MVSVTTGLSLTLGVIGTLLEVAVFVLAIRRKLSQQLALLSIYIFVLFPRDLTLDWFIYVQQPKTPHAISFFLYSYWTTAILLSFLRILLIAEICKRVLTQSLAVWKLAWRLLAFVGSCLIVWTAFGVMHDRHVMREYITTLEARLNILAAFFTLAVMGIGSYYRLLVFPLFQRVLIGSCIYSAVQLVDTRAGPVHTESYELCL